eukprot:5969619-Prymnesium_polylepis.1
MLPSLSELCSTDIPLHGVRRPGGRRAPNEDAPGIRSRSILTPMTVGAGEDRLKALASELRAPRAGPNSLVQRWREAVRTSM